MSNLENSSVSRRSAIQLSAAAVGAMSISTQAAHHSESAKVSLKKGDTILFQGDSITDAGRDRKRQVANEARSFGNGYPSLIGPALLADHPQLDLKIHNRGISGNKVPDLDARWQVDCLDLKPALISILIGVNDIWHKLNGRYDGTPEVYRDGFLALIERTQAALPDTTIAICEPFVLRCGAVNDSWFPEFETRRAFAEEVAEKTGSIWVPFQKALNDAIAAGTEPAYWGSDGVHPSQAGHALMAKTWRETLGL
ncbi:MAG: SGNH/GDSL hydrolase family protein [Verrucomicrobiota bacterium]